VNVRSEYLRNTGARAASERTLWARHRNRTTRVSRLDDSAQRAASSGGPYGMDFPLQLWTTAFCAWPWTS